ncbi:unnamed protein product [Alopecurus aequalis]
MNCLRNTRSLLSRIILHCKAPATRCYQGLLHDLGLNQESAQIKPLFRRQSTSPRSFVLRWYHDPRKVAAATAITMSATVMAACSRYDREIVPCTYRSHLVIFSHEQERDIGDSVFAEHVANYVILDPRDPRRIRVRRIAERIVHAAHRGLGIYDSNDAPMLRVTGKRRKWGKAQPHTSHLRWLNWEVILVKDDNPNVKITPSGKIIVHTGLFNWFKTDEEIAAHIAHEVAHVIARHAADISKIHGFLKRRMEIEADYIGILLLGAAGFHPQWFHVIMEKAAKFESDSLSGPNPKKRFQLVSAAKTMKEALDSLSRPRPKKRLQLLSEAMTMKEALELYTEVTAMDTVTDRYFR